MDESVITSTYSPLSFAFLGDAVYSLYVRKLVIMNGNMSAHKLHQRATEYVNAGAQAKAADAIQAILTEEEKDIYKRGENAKTESHAKNASLYEYHKATGLETLLGWMYLKGDMRRLEEVLEACIYSNLQ